MFISSQVPNKHDVMLMMQLSSCLQKKNTKIMALAANPVANFFSSSSIAPLLSV